ncbi:hypothetical protein SO694_00054254 [Aureococcus anophagefferens]|uniref:Uncharacterized protein n=1 Tax=Aureococcus anophagefferens TaxID=44056 RepID=A0ABR1FXV0_AURAN
MNRMLTADVCAGDEPVGRRPPAVLRATSRGHDVSVLGKTLKADEARRANDLLSKKMGAADGEQDATPLPSALQGRGGGFDRAKTGAIGVSLKQDLKKLQREKRELQDNFPGGASAFLDACIADGALKALTLQEREAVAEPAGDLRHADELALQLDQDPPPRRLMGMMLDWAATKDIHRVARCVDPHLLGSFVKSVMRACCPTSRVREVLLGLGEYETHNALDHHTDALVCGLVTNESLYLRIEA